MMPHCALVLVHDISSQTNNMYVDTGLPTYQHHRVELSPLTILRIYLTQGLGDTEHVHCDY